MEAENPILPETGIDEALGSFQQFVEGLTNMQDQFRSEELGMEMRISSLKLNLPIELQVLVDEDTGRVTLGTAPPTQQEETTFMPVFHQLHVTIIEEHDAQ